MNNKLHNLLADHPVLLVSLRVLMVVITGGDQSPSGDSQRVFEKNLAQRDPPRKGEKTSTQGGEVSTRNWDVFLGNFRSIYNAHHMREFCSFMVIF